MWSSFIAMQEKAARGRLSVVTYFSVDLLQMHKKLLLTMDKKDSVMARALHSLLKLDMSNTLSKCICVKSNLQFLSLLRRLSCTPYRTLVARVNASPMWRLLMGQIFQPFGPTKRVWIWRLTVFTMPRRGLFKSRKGYVRIWSLTLLSD